MTESLEKQIKKILSSGNLVSFCGYRINYDILQGLDDKEPVKRTGEACFGSLGQAFHQKKFDLSSPIYLHVHRLQSKFLDESLYVPWISLLQSVGVLSYKQSAEEISKEGLLLQLDKSLSIFDFYLQVTCIRYLAEAFGMVRNILTLTKEGADFWGAFWFLHEHSISNSNHSLATTEVQGGSGALAPVISLKRHLRGPAKVDKRPLIEALAKKPSDSVYRYNTVPWQVYTNLLKLSLGCKQRLVEPWRLADPNMIPIFHSNTEEELKESLESFKEEHPDVAWSG